MNQRMPKGKPSKVFQGVHARLVFPDHRDEAAVLDLMRRFSSATRFAYNRLLEGRDRKELKREDGPLCRLFRLNTRYADGAIEKAQAILDSARELGQDPRKVVFGGRKLFEGLKRRHLSGKTLLALKRAWKERRQGLLYSEKIHSHVQGFYGDRLQELRKLKEAEKNPHLRWRLSREMGKAKAALTLVSSLRGSSGSRKGSTDGRNPSGTNAWRGLRVGLFLPLLGLETPRDLSPLKPILHGPWEEWKVGLGPHPGGGPECANVRFC